MSIAIFKKVKQIRFFCNDRRVAVTPAPGDRGLQAVAFGVLSWSDQNLIRRQASNYPLSALAYPSSGTRFVDITRLELGVEFI
jgi:hypothetical protein